MSCANVMYQSTLPSCFSSFTPTNYASVGYHQPLTNAGASSSTGTCSESFKKLGTSRMYSDRYTSGRIGDPLGGLLDHSDITHGSGHGSRVSSNGFYGGHGSTSGKDVSYEDSKTSSRIQYLTPNSYLNSDHPGDTTTAVEDHFNRSLNLSKGHVPMRSRNLPASFFTPSPPVAEMAHQVPSYSLPYGYAATSTDYPYSDSYYSSTFHPASFQHPQTDPWHYAYNSAAVAAQSLTAQRAAALAADFSANRFNSSYNSLYFPSASSMRSSRLDVGGGCKSGSAWAAHPAFASDSGYGTSSADYDIPLASKAHSSKDIHWH